MPELVKLKNGDAEALVERNTPTYEAYLSQGYTESDEPVEPAEPVVTTSASVAPGDAPDVDFNHNNSSDVLSGDPVSGASVPPEKRDEELLPGSRSVGQIEGDVTGPALRNDPEVPVTGDADRDSAMAKNQANLTDAERESLQDADKEAKDVKPSAAARKKS